MGGTAAIEQNRLKSARAAAWLSSPWSHYRIETTRRGSSNFDPVLEPTQPLGEENTLSDEDTGTIAAVPPDQRRDVDDRPEDSALEGGADDDLDDIFSNPGELVELSDKEE